MQVTFCKLKSETLRVFILLIAEAFSVLVLQFGNVSFPYSSSIKFCVVPSHIFPHTIWMPTHMGWFLGVVDFEMPSVGILFTKRVGNEVSRFAGGSVICRKVTHPSVYVTRGMHRVGTH